MKRFEMPSMTVIGFDVENILTSSGEQPKAQSSENRAAAALAELGVNSKNIIVF